MAYRPDRRRRTRGQIRILESFRWRFGTRVAPRSKGNSQWSPCRRQTPSQSTEQVEAQICPRTLAVQLSDLRSHVAKRRFDGRRGFQPTAQISTTGYRTMKRRIVLVSGSPAAGKTSLARPLARLLALPLIAKDDIKETLVDVLGDQDGDLGWSRKVGGAAMELLWKLAE